MVFDFKVQEEIRSRLIEEIKLDLLGPRKGKTPKERECEDTTRNPKGEYVAGVLYPEFTLFDDEDLEDDLSCDTNEEDLFDSISAKDSMFKPSSFGLTCRLENNTGKIKAVINYGVYQKLKNDERFRYKRNPKQQVTILDLELESNEVSFDDNHNFIIKYKIANVDKAKILNVYIINKTKNNKLYWKDVIFQPELILESVDGSKCFIQNNLGFMKKHYPPDDENLEILFNEKISFGEGHLCALTWDDKKVENKKIDQIKTTFIPSETLDYIDHREPSDTLESSVKMIELGDCMNPSELRTLLEPIIHEYQSWLNQVSSELVSKKEYSSSQINLIKTNIENSKIVISRMYDGLNYLEKDEKAFESFKFANMAMAWQQAHGAWAKDNIKKGSVEGHDLLRPIYNGVEPKWRLFQIAFILMNLESVANPDSKYRQTVDLLWFPTGGGKTEAYLGLVAFVVAYRRLRGINEKGQHTHNSFGTAVIMRYTLRLLTVQQFQRAATLFCACEKIRRTKSNEKKNLWGNIPFQVGLWVGQSVTPNYRETAAQRKFELGNLDLSEIENNNPYILLNCPWCGKKLNSYCGKIDGEPEQWRLFCPRNNCLFSKHPTDKDISIPVITVDEDIYSRCPSLIISTVDKYAQISLEPKVRSIFGHVTRHCDIHGFYHESATDHPSSHRNMNKPPSEYILEFESLPPPELIIQDELHLISGSLGTMASLFETAIEYFCTTNGKKPKIISSTATTRAASDHILKLFGRDDTIIFPPQIEKFGDTFFSKINREKPGKTYLGVLATGKSQLTVAAKVSAVILRRIRQFEEDKKYLPEYLDPYFTLVSYYNSIRELAGASMNFKDSVPDFIKQIKRHFDDSVVLPPLDASWIQTNDEEVEKITQEEQPELNAARTSQFRELHSEELTSRKQSGEIPLVLRKLEENILDNPPPKKGEFTDKPLDLLLATNMMSVGVDVQRLGIMMVNGQPKNNSEYIQATGRIGRSSPGLIVTLYSYTRPRDISHYENFREYHSTYYKNIETVSLTPFTDRSRRMGLFGVIVGLIRMSAEIKSLIPNKGAPEFNLKNKAQIDFIEKIKKIIRERCDHVSRDESTQTLEHVENVLNQWTQLVKEHDTNLQYKEPYHEKLSQEKLERYRYLLKTDMTSKRQFIPVPVSLRTAEQEQNLQYVELSQSVESEEND